MSKCIDRVETRCTARWHETKKNTDGCRKNESDDVDLGIEKKRRAEDFGEGLTQSVSECDPTHATDAGKRDRLDKELE